MTWYAKQSDSWAQVINPYVKGSSNWNTVNEGWVRDEGVWKRFYYRDISPPGAPSLSITEVAAGIEIEVTVSLSSNAAQVDMRGSVTAGALTEINNSFWEVQSVSPGDVVTYLWETDIVPGTTYRVEARLLSNTGVSSAVIVDTIVIPPATNYYQAYIEATNSDSWVDGDWLVGSNQVIQGGVNNLHKGCWFYGNRLDRLMGMTVTKMEIQIKRIDSDHGIGLANVRLAHHDNKTKPGSSPNMLGTTKVGEIRRGERKWFTVPKEWYREYKQSNNNYRGFGIHTTDLGASSPNYLRSPEDSADTLNGRLYVEWHD